MSSELGKALPHESALGHVSGEARYVDDLPEPAGTLQAMALSSPHAHARIVSIDKRAALAVPGVHAVLLAEDLPAVNNVGPVVHDEPLLAQQIVQCVGQHVALVIAETRAAGRAAIGAIEVVYEPLPARISLDEAIEAGAFHGKTHTICRGDPDGALASSPHRIAGTTRSGGQDHFYLETQCALAIPGENRTLRVHCSTQHPSEVQALVAETLGWGRHQVVVETARLGGGFGGKETQAAWFACFAALGCRVTGRPVKCWLDRDTDMSVTGRRHPFRTDWEVGFDDEGKILGFAAKLVSDGGWASDLSMAILDRGLFHVDNCYWLENVRLIGEVAHTHTVSNTAFRGFGGPQGMVVMEQVMERISVYLGRDPLQVREHNFYRSGSDHTPYGQRVPDFRIPKMVKSLQTTAQLHERKAGVERFNAGSRFRKRGLALTPVKFGISFTASFLNQAGAYVVCYADGTVQLNHGGVEMGQGLHTKMLQVCAHELGVPLAAVRAMSTGTDKVPNTSATAASSGADLNGAAIREAVAPLVERLRAVASRHLGTESFQCAAGSLRYPDGAWAWTDTEQISFAELCSRAYLDQVQLSSAGFYATPGIGYDRERGQGTPFHYFAYGCAVSEVEVNGLTGEWRLLRVDILHDVGDSLSEDMDRGQVEGGFIQGMGWLTSEELVFGDDGRLLTHSPSTYKIPAVGDTPLEFRVDLLEKAPQPGVIHGSKAVGEPPFMLAISTHCALQRACSAFGDPVTLAIPATPEALLFAVEAAKSARLGLRATGK